MVSLMRRYLVAGLLLWLPILVTILILRFIINLLDGVLAIFPSMVQPNTVFGVHIPGLGLVLALVVLFFSGMFVTNFLGERIVAVWEKGINRIPLIRSLYAGVKQVTQAFFSPSGAAFRQVLLIEYPRKGCWTLAFQTGEAGAELNARVDAELVSVFVPTTPNPTSGFFLLLPKQDVIVMDMTVEQALKFIISLGVVQP